MVKTIIPSTQLIIRSKDKKISCWLQYTNKLISPFFRIEVNHIPLSYVIIHGRPSWQWYITG